MGCSLVATSDADICMLFIVLLQMVDKAVASVWEGHNKGKLFKDLTIPAAEE